MSRSWWVITLCCALIGACAKPHDPGAAAASASAAPAPSAAESTSAAPASSAATGPRGKSRFPKLFLAPSTQHFACTHYVNCFDDSHGHCVKQREGGELDADWTHRTRVAADGSPSACCYMTTMCKRPLRE